jgi:TolC family type I secretion outer membrane protein
MGMLFRHLVLGTAFAVSVAGPAVAATFSLKEALATAYDTNYQLAGERANQRAVVEGVARANAGWRPNLSLNGYTGTTTINRSPSDLSTKPLEGDVMLTQPLPINGKTYADVQRAKAQEMAGRAQLADTEQNVLLSAVTAYMDTQRDTQRVEVARDNVATLQKLLDSINKQFSGGAITKTDVQLTEARLSQAKVDLYAAEASLGSSRASFEHVIGRPAETLEEQPALARTPPSLDDAVAQARTQHPQLLLAQQQERAAKYAVDDAVSDLLPQASVVGQYRYSRDYQTFGSFQAQAPQNQWSVLLQLQVPVYQGGAESAAVRQANQLHGKARIAVSDADQQVVQNVNTTWAAFNAARSSLTASEAVVNSNQQAVQGIIREQQAGERSVIDVLNAQQDYQNSRQGHLNAVHDSVVASYRLVSAIGRLNAHELALNVKFYDPQAYYDDNAGRWYGFGSGD